MVLLRGLPRPGPPGDAAGRGRRRRDRGARSAAGFEPATMNRTA